MSASRAEKRKREPTQAEKYLMENHESEMGKVMADFKAEVDSKETSVPKETSEPSVPKETSEPSVPNETGPAHILYYDAFLAHPMRLKTGETHVDIFPKEWANAFIQRDLSTTATELCKGMRTPKNIDNREEFKNLIRKASVWMMSKVENNIDPWSFQLNNEANQELPDVTEDAKHEVDEIVERYLNRQPEPNHEITQPEPLQEIPDFGDMMMSPPSPGVLLDLDAILDGFNKYERIFEGFAKEMEDSSVHAAHMACALTRGTIPTNTDIFVDAVQFDHKRWMWAAVPPIVDEIGTIAAKISKTILFRVESQKGGIIESADDFCSVKRLAIYRGAKFIYETYNGRINARAFDFNSETLEHNVYPTFEECGQIDAALLELGKIMSGHSNITSPGNQSSNDPSTDTSASNEDFRELIHLSSTNSASSSNSSYYPEEQASPPWEPVLEDPGEFLAHGSMPTANNDMPPIPELTFKTWEMVKRKYEYKKDGQKGLVKAGKALFRILFTDDEELKNSTPTGIRGSKGPLDPEKQDKIMNTLKHLHSVNPRTKKSWSSMEDELKIKVIRETCSQLRRKLGKSKN